MKNVGVVVFPGTNCDHETMRVFAEDARCKATQLWHDDTLPSGLDLVILPGGWSYGDTLRAGTIARFSKIMPGIVEHAKRGALVLGICNGFQILTEAGLLPGALARNDTLRFRSEMVYCRVENCNTPFLKDVRAGTVVPLPIAHGEGRYVASDAELERMEAHGLIAMRYSTERGITSESANPNGSLRNIAGIVNRAGNVLGMMPHPERQAVDWAMGGEGKQLLFGWLAA